MTSLSSSKTEFACVFYDVFGVGGFTGLIRGRVLTIFFWAFSHLLLIGISIKIVLALVASFPTNLVSSNLESVCRSCVSFGVLKRGCCGCKFLVPLLGAVLPRLLPWLLPLSKTRDFGPERYYRLGAAVVLLWSGTTAQEPR